jgi:DNA-binding response OmpR family regulator
LKTNKANIFLVEDDHNFGSVLKAYLEMNDYAVDWVKDGKHAIKQFSEGDYDICVLDVMLPNMDGFTIAENIRKLNAGVSLVFLTAKTLKQDILKGYGLGADDYITKPFDSEVLLCQINAILNRKLKTKAAKIEQEVYILGRYTFNYNLRTIYLNAKEQKLSPKEAELLRLLCQKRNNILPRDLALRSIWGDDSYFTTRSMDVFITKLRKYLKEDPSVEIINIHGNGFRLVVPV